MTVVSAQGFEPFALSPSKGFDGLSLNGYCDFTGLDQQGSRRYIAAHHDCQLRSHCLHSSHWFECSQGYRSGPVKSSHSVRAEPFDRAQGERAKNPTGRSNSTCCIARTLSLFCVSWALLGLAGCDQLFSSSKLPDPAMSPEAIATRDAPAELKFQGQLAGEPTFLLVHDCEVYRVDQSADGGVQWTSVLAPDVYPMWTSCQRESMSFKGGELTVTLGRMALGAGGCCATGGTYRSKDGRVWKKV